MQVRRIEVAGLVAGLVVGVALKPAALHGDPARLLSTFLGLVSASVLPSISLILATMSPGGRSVKAINELESELSKAMNGLFLMLGLVGVIFGAIFMLSLEPPRFFGRIPYLGTQILPRLGQAIVCAGTFLIIARAGQIPMILARSLKIRHEIAVDEARRKTLENVTKIGDPKDIFKRDPQFGEIVKINEVERDE